MSNNHHTAFETLKRAGHKYPQQILDDLSAEGYTPYTKKQVDTQCKEAVNSFMEELWEHAEQSLKSAKQSLATLKLPTLHDLRKLTDKDGEA